MKASETLSRLRSLRVAVVTTADASATLGLSIEAASQALRRLAAAGLVTPVRKGVWALGENPSAIAIADHITAPHPSYVSLQSALYLHGLIEQMPAATYLVSLGRTGVIRTRVGTYSVHHVAPEFFGGAVQDPTSQVRMATPEKALVDFLYLSPTRSRLFARLPELDLPRNFSARLARHWARRIPSQRMRTIVERQLEAIIGGRGGHRRGQLA